ncbi:MAG: HD domain-containing protein [Desulfobacterales bacterium]|nr:HD domain-containing protein [Desulfobacterales bacterium]
MAPFDGDDTGNLRREMDERERGRLGLRATLSRDALRRRVEPRLRDGYRQSFSVDVDRILHSRAYARYIDKTQVFSLIHHDHITHRVLHVQLVSKIARTIGRFLGLNEDLIEAIALGHDIGHPPFGHDGERILSRLCVQAGIGAFHHNVQSVRFLDGVERQGRGWNLTLQTLDGILCHDGEVHDPQLAPAGQKTFDQLALEMTAVEAASAISLIPMTMEGCVVRMSDTIGYVGRDIEDAIRLNLIRRSDLPRRSTTVLGDTNGTIVYRLVTDIIAHRRNTDVVAFSPEVSEALRQLKAFNLERIYLNPDIKAHLPGVTRRFEALFHTFLEDLRQGNEASVIHTGFLCNMSDAYAQKSRPVEIVRDFMAGMTDRYFLDQGPHGKAFSVTRPAVGAGSGP